MINLLGLLLEAIVREHRVDICRHTVNLINYVKDNSDVIDNLTAENIHELDNYDRIPDILKLDDEVEARDRVNKVIAEIYKARGAIDITDEDSVAAKLAFNKALRLYSVKNTCKVPLSNTSIRDAFTKDRSTEDITFIAGQHISNNAFDLYQIGKAIRIVHLKPSASLAGVIMVAVCKGVGKKPFVPQVMDDPSDDGAISSVNLAPGDYLAFHIGIAKEKLPLDSGESESQAFKIKNDAGELLVERAPYYEVFDDNAASAAKEFGDNVLGPAREARMYEAKAQEAKTREYMQSLMFALQAGSETGSFAGAGSGDASSSGAACGAGFGCGK